MRRSRWLAALAVAFVLAAFMSVRPAGAQEGCPNGLCSGHRPGYSDTAWVSWIGHRIAVGTEEAQSGSDYALTIYDLDTGIPPLNTNWDPAAGLMRRYHGPLDGSGFGDWRADTLGTIFGLTLDNLGNIYVTYTSMYYNDLISQLPGATSGSVFKIDRITGFVSVFANLPQQLDPVYSSGSFPVSSGWPGLGNITFDPVHNYLFVTDMEDGKIYRLNMSGTITASFDPMAPDNGAPGFAPVGQRLWAIQWHADNFLYYSVWNTDGRTVGGPKNTIRRVQLDGSGNFIGGTDVLRIQLPYLPWSNHSNPVSDISFGPTGHMIVAEHDIQNDTWPYAHTARLMEYQCNLGSWTLSANTYLVGQYNNQFNSAGGTDWDYDTYSGGVPGRVWVTGDALHLNTNDYIYGAQGFPPTGGGPPNSYFFDYNGSVLSVDKFQLGDIEVPCPPDTGSIHGSKVDDANCDGRLDSGETPIAGWPIVLTGPNGTFTVYTDANGNFHFWGLPNGNYTVCELGQAGWTTTLPATGCYNVTVAGNTVSGLLFLNCHTCPQPTACVQAPPNMTAWWPLDETSGPTAHDISGTNPGTWFGPPSPGPGKRGNALCFNGPAQYVRVNDSSQINFGVNADFSIDAWIYPTNVTGLQFIVDKRVAVGANFRGYVLAVQNGSLLFGMNDGASSAATYTSPVVLVTNQWQHVAITVKRALNGGTAYLNGALLGTFNPLSTGAGNLTNNSFLYIGRNLSGTKGFEGCLDEIEIFCRQLTAAEVLNVYSPGKCRQWCSIPPVINFAPSQLVATATFSICNYDWSAPSMNYSWSLNGLPPGTCSVPGPTSYTPSSGVMTIPAGSCQTVTVTIPRPVWLTPGNTGCFVFNVNNNTNHTCFNCTGQVKATKKLWVDVQIDSIILPHDASGIARFTVHNDGPVGTLRLVQVRMDVGEPGSSPDAAYVRLNGLPPGEPWIGTMSVVGGGGVGVGVPISWPSACNLVKIPDQWLRISVLDDDTDPVGTMEDVASIHVRLADGDEVGVEPPTTMPGVEAVTAWPNPSMGGTRVRMSLTQRSMVDAGVYDLAGRMVRRLQRGPLEAGAHDFAWDGRDDGGRVVKAGLYFIRMRADDREYGARLVKVK